MLKSKIFVLLAALFILSVIAGPRIQNVTNKRRSLSASPTTSSRNSQTTTGPLPPFELHSSLTSKVGVFAKDLVNPRDLEFSPHGTLIVSLTQSGKVVALPDQNQDGVADKTVEILSNLDTPHGLAFYEGKLFVAEETRIVRYRWDEEKLTVVFEKEILKLPLSQGGHFTRSLVFNKQGQLFVTIGSTCNVCIESNPWHAAVIMTNQDGNNPKIFATGLRNSVFLIINPNTNELWAADMGRDLLGDDIPPEEINILQEGKDYGWPTCYGNKIHDVNFDKNQYIQDPCLDTQPPIFEFQAHSAPLGLMFIDSAQFPKDWQGDLFVAYHGSWNRSVPTGYKVVRMEVKGNTIAGMEDFLTGFLDSVTVHGRPVDVIFDKEGSLFVSDDKAGMIYKVVPS